MSKKKFIRFDDWADIRSISSHIEDNPDRPESERVDRVLVLLSRLGMLQQNRNKWTGADKAEVMKTRNELSRLLGEYQWGVKIAETQQGFRAILLPVNSDRSVWECVTVRGLLNLTHSPDLLRRIRRCEVCNAWLLSTSRIWNRQRFCIDKPCKQRDYDSKPENQERKRKTMRDNYDTRYPESVEKRKQRRSFKKNAGKKA